MADEAGKATSWLSNTFNKVVKHMFSPTMIFMMAAMAFPIVASAAGSLGAGATFGDIGLATVDMYGEMIAAPFTDGGVVVDAFSNAADGNFAPTSYEMGMMDHSQMGHDMTDMPDMASAPEAFANALDGLSPEELSEAYEMAKMTGQPFSDFIMSMAH
mgnify:CR=1 FL=1